MAGFILAFILVIIVRSLFLNWRKQCQAEKELNELYRRGENAVRENRVAKFEYDDAIIYLTTLNELPLTYSYRGKSDSLNKTGKKEGDIVLVNDKYYVYVQDRWYEIFDDMPRYPLT